MIVVNNWVLEVYVLELEDYDMDLEEESKWLIVFFYIYMYMLEKVYVCSIYLFMYFMIVDESWEYLIDV